MQLSQQILNEFINNCREGDLIKARLVLEQCDQIETTTQKRILYELNKCDDGFALPLMMFISVKHQQAIEKFPMLSESIRERAGTSPMTIKTQLQTKTPEQADYVNLVTRLNLRETVPWLIQLLASTSDPELQVRIISSLGLLKAERAVAAIAGFLDSCNGSIVDATIDALGTIGTPAAINLLNQLLPSKGAHERNRAKYRLVEIGGKAVECVAKNLLSSDIDLQIHSLNILQAIGDAGAVQPVRRLINTKPADANVRFAAYEALAILPVRKGDYVLAAGLTDTDDAIRLAAARAIDRHIDDSVVKGVSNMLIPADEEAERIAKAILDSHSGTLSMHLMSNRFFKTFLIRHLSHEADIGMHTFFRDLLKRSGHESTADAIEKARNGAGKVLKKGIICAVDDSKMILKVYQSILNQLDYQPVVFEKPAEFLSWLKDEKPIALFTDLNMPEVTGIDLTAEVRKTFSKTELPIIMVTTQNDKTDSDAAYKAGVDVVISKPFDTEKIQSTLESYLSSGP